MTTTMAPTSTRVDEIADGIYRLSTPIPLIPGGFSFNQYLVADDEPLLFHTGPRGLFPAVREAVARVLPAGVAPLRRLLATSSPTSAAR